MKQMGKYKFGNTSLDKLSTCDPGIQLIMMEAIRTSRVDFGIACGHRSIEDQQKAFKEGKSRVDGIKVKGKHNYFPSHAVDVYAYYNGKAQWDDIHMGYLVGHILSVADRLFEEGKVKFKLRSGADWNDNGVLVYDQKLKDMPHFEKV